MTTAASGFRGVNVVRESGQTGLSNETVYTVPSGRFAVVSVNHIREASGSANKTLTFGSAEVTVGTSETLSPLDADIRLANAEITLDSGQDILVASSVEYDFVILEFNKP